MKKLIISVILLFTLLGCTTVANEDSQLWLLFDKEYIRNGDSMGSFSVSTFVRCEDRVVCYFAERGSGGGFSCHTDEFIVNKYCGVQR